MPLLAAADYKVGLQVGLPEGSPPSQDDREIQHLHRWHVTGCLSHEGLEGRQIHRSGAIYPRR